MMFKNNIKKVTYGIRKLTLGAVPVVLGMSMIVGVAQSNLKIVNAQESIAVFNKVHSTDDIEAKVIEMSETTGVVKVVAKKDIEKVNVKIKIDDKSTVTLKGKSLKKGEQHNFIFEVGKKVERTLPNTATVKKSTVVEGNVGGHKVEAIISYFIEENTNSEKSMEQLNKRKEEPKVEDKPKEEPKVEEKPKEEPKAEEKPKEEPKVEEKPKEEPKVEEKPKEEPRVEDKPKEEPKVEEKPKEEPKVEDKPKEEPKVEDKPKEEPKVEDKPKEEPKVEDKPKEEPKVEEKPKEEPKVEEKPKEEPKVEDKPKEEPKVEEKPKEEPKVEEKPKEEPKVEEKPKEEPKVEDKPKEELKVEEKPKVEDSDELKNIREKLNDATRVLQGLIVFVQTDNEGVKNDNEVKEKLVLAQNTLKNVLSVMNTNLTLKELNNLFDSVVNKFDDLKDAYDKARYKKFKEEVEKLTNELTLEISSDFNKEQYTDDSVKQYEKKVEEVRNLLQSEDKEELEKLKQAKIDLANAKKMLVRKDGRIDLITEKHDFKPDMPKIEEKPKVDKETQEKINKLKSELTVETIKEFEENKYTEESAKKYKEKLEEIKQLLKSEVSLEKLQQVKTELDNVRQMLVKKNSLEVTPKKENIKPDMPKIEKNPKEEQANKEEIEKLKNELTLETIQTFEEDKYTEESAKKYKEKLEIAKKLLNSKEKDSLEKLQQAKTELANAKKMLEGKNGIESTLKKQDLKTEKPRIEEKPKLDEDSKDAVKKKLAEVKKIVDSWDKSKYRDGSITKYEETVKNAKQEIAKYEKLLEENIDKVKSEEYIKNLDMLKNKLLTSQKDLKLKATLKDLRELRTGLELKIENVKEIYFEEGKVKIDTKKEEEILKKLTDSLQTELTQAEMDSLYDEATIAFQEFYKKVDISLEREFEKAKQKVRKSITEETTRQLNEDEYTTDSLAAYKKEVEKARKILSMEIKSSEELIKFREVWKNLENAKKKLVKKNNSNIEDTLKKLDLGIEKPKIEEKPKVQEDKKEVLKKKIEEVEGIINSWDKSKYREGSTDYYEASLESAKQELKKYEDLSMKNDLNESEIEAVIKDIDRLIAGLIGDQSGLELKNSKEILEESKAELVDLVTNINGKDILKDNSDIKSLIEKAKEVLKTISEKENSQLSEQELENIFNDMTNAYDSLKAKAEEILKEEYKKQVQSLKTELTKLTIVQITESEYTEESLAKYKVELEKAKQSLNSDELETLKTALEGLKQAKTELVKKNNTIDVISSIKLL